MEPRVDFSAAELSNFEDVDRRIDVCMRAPVWLACVAYQSQGLSGPVQVVLSYHSDSDSDDDGFDSDSDDFDYEPSSRVHDCDLFIVSLVWFSLDYKGIQPGMAAQPMRTR